MAAPLFEAFVICGAVPNQPLATVHGETGVFTPEARFQPGIVDSMNSQGGREVRLPPQFAMCCLPAGVELVLPDSHHGGLQPRIYSLVLTGEDGTRLYVSCLQYYEELPPAAALPHRLAWGAAASRAMCLVSHHPYLSTMEAILRRLYTAVFVTGAQSSVADMVAAILAVPLPGSGSPDDQNLSTLQPAANNQEVISREPASVQQQQRQEAGAVAGVTSTINSSRESRKRKGQEVCFLLAGRTFRLDPPCPGLGIPVSELPVRPLLEALSVDHLVTVFLAVLLERRVLLRSSCYRLLTQAGEALRSLLYPLRLLHTYIPVLPWVLADYVEAPTTFLMGLHSGVELDPRSLDSQVVVVNLDRDEVTPSRQDDLAQHLSHPAVARLRARLSALKTPSLAAGDVLSLLDQGSMPISTSSATTSSGINTSETTASGAGSGSKKAKVGFWSGLRRRSSKGGPASPEAVTSPGQQGDVSNTKWDAAGAVAAQRDAGGSGGASQQHPGPTAVQQQQQRRAARSSALHGTTATADMAATAAAAAAMATGNGWDAAAVVAIASASAKAGPPPDVWVTRASHLAQQGWSPAHENFVRRLFLSFMSALLRGYHQFLPGSTSSQQHQATAAADSGVAASTYQVHQSVPPVQTTAAFNTGGGIGSAPGSPFAAAVAACLPASPSAQRLQQLSPSAAAAAAAGGPFAMSPGMRAQLLQAPSSPTRGASGRHGSSWFTPGGSFTYSSHHGAAALHNLLMATRESSASSASGMMSPILGSMLGINRSGTSRSTAAFDSGRFVAWQDKKHKSGGPLLSQLSQTLMFYTFLEEYGGITPIVSLDNRTTTTTVRSHPYSWYRAGCDAFVWDRSDAGSPDDCGAEAWETEANTHAGANNTTPVPAAARGQPACIDSSTGAFTCTPVAHALLHPPSALPVYHSFPALSMCESGLLSWSPDPSVSTSNSQSAKAGAPAGTSATAAGYAAVADGLYRTSSLTAGAVSLDSPRAGSSSNQRQSSQANGMAAAGRQLLLRASKARAGAGRAGAGVGLLLPASRASSSHRLRRSRSFSIGGEPRTSDSHTALHLLAHPTTPGPGAAQRRLRPSASVINLVGSEHHSSQQLQTQAQHSNVSPRAGAVPGAAGSGGSATGYELLMQLAGLRHHSTSTSCDSLARTSSQQPGGAQQHPSPLSRLSNMGVPGGVRRAPSRSDGTAVRGAGALAHHGASRQHASHAAREAPKQGELDMYCLVADLVRRQSLAVRQLLAWPLDKELPADAGEAVKTLLRMQMASSACFLLSVLREEVLTPAQPTTAAEEGQATSTAHDSAAATSTDNTDSRSPAAPHHADRVVHPSVFGVLVDALAAIIGACVSSSDWALLVQALEVAEALVCVGKDASTATQGGRVVGATRLLSCLGRAQPLLYSSWVWCGILGVLLARTPSPSVLLAALYRTDPSGVHRRSLSGGSVAGGQHMLPAGNSNTNHLLPGPRLMRHDYGRRRTTLDSNVSDGDTVQLPLPGAHLLSAMMGPGGTGASAQGAQQQQQAGPGMANNTNSSQSTEVSAAAALLASQAREAGVAYATAAVSALSTAGSWLRALGVAPAPAWRLLTHAALVSVDYEQGQLRQTIAQVWEAQHAISSSDALPGPAGAPGAVMAPSEQQPDCARLPSVHLLRCMAQALPGLRPILKDPDFVSTSGASDTAGTTPESIWPPTGLLSFPLAAYLSGSCTSSSGKLLLPGSSQYGAPGHSSSSAGWDDAANISRVGTNNMVHHSSLSPAGNTSHPASLRPKPGAGPDGRGEGFSPYMGGSPDRYESGYEECDQHQSHQRVSPTHSVRSSATTMTAAGLHGTTVKASHVSPRRNGAGAAAGFHRAPSTIGSSAFSYAPSMAAGTVKGDDSASVATTRMRPGSSRPAWQDLNPGAAKSQAAAARAQAAAAGATDKGGPAASPRMRALMQRAKHAGSARSSASGVPTPQAMSEAVTPRASYAGTEHLPAGMTTSPSLPHPSSSASRSTRHQQYPRNVEQWQQQSAAVAGSLAKNLQGQVSSLASDCHQGHPPQQQHLQSYPPQESTDPASPLAPNSPCIEHASTAPMPPMPLASPASPAADASTGGAGASPSKAALLSQLLANLSKGSSGASAVAVVAALRASASGGTQSLQKGAAVQDSPQLAVYAEQQQQPIPLPSIGGSSSGDSGVSTNMSSTDRVHDSNCMRSASLASAGGVSSSADGSLAGGRSQMAGGGDGSATAGFAKGSPQQQCIAGSPSHSSLTQDCLTLHDCQHAADLQGKPAGSGLPSVVPDGRWRFTARVEGTGAVAEAVPSASRGSRIAAPMPAANSVDVQSWGSSSLPMGLPIMSMAACQGLLVVGCAEPLLQILRTVDGSLLRAGSVPLPPGCGGASLLRLSPDGATAVAAHASDHAVAVADVAARRLVARLIPGHTSPVTSLIPSPSGSLVLSGSLDGCVRLWDLRGSHLGGTGGASGTRSTATLSILAGQGGVTCMALMAHGGGGTRSPVTRSPLGNGSTAAGAAMGVELATGGRDGSIRVWDIRRTSVPLLELRGHTGPVTLLEAVPHTSIPGICGMHGGGLLTSGILVSGSEDWTVRIWDRQQSPTSPGQHGTCDHSSSAMHSTCSNGADDHCLAVLSGHGGPVSSAVVIPGSAASGSAPLLASGAKDGSVMVWDMTAAIASGGAHGCIWLGQAHRPGVPVTIIVPAVLPDQISSTSGNTGTPGKRAGGQGQGLHGTGSNAGHHQKASSYAARAAQQAAISPFSPTRWAPGAVTSGGSSTTSGAVSAPMFVSAAEDATCAVWAACSSTGHAMGSNGSHTQHDSQAECSGTHACTGQQHVQGYCRSTGGCPVAVVGFQGRCSRVPVPCAAYDASIGVMYTGGPQGVVKAWHYHSQAGL